jgi:hypothetical protein
MHDVLLLVMFLGFVLGPAGLAYVAVGGLFPATDEVGRLGAREPGFAGGIGELGE